METMKLTLSLDMDGHKLDAWALSEGLSGFCSFLQAMREETNEAEGLDVQVEAIHPGSFQFALELIGHVVSLTGLMTGGGVQTLMTLVQMAVEYLKLKIFLGDEKPDEVRRNGDVVIVLKDGAQLNISSVVHNAYMTNGDAAQASQSMANAFRSDERVRGIKLKDADGTELAGFDGEQLHRLALSNAYLNEEHSVICDKRAVLLVRAPSLDGSTKWRFLYNGRKIIANIADESFMEKVKSGELRFGNGDRLLAVLEIGLEKKPGRTVWKESSYSVVSVDVQGFQNAEQQSLF